MVSAPGDESGRRPSIEKNNVMEAAGDPTSSAFGRLPDEIIEQILKLTDPNGFASLALLNSKWRSVVQQAHLYAFHLSRCPSYSMSHSHKALPVPVSDDELPELRKRFAREVKRNLFEAYRRPSTTIVKLISNSISSSSCPGGEGIQFSASPQGHYALAYNSSRIYVINLQGPEIAVERELKILRRPAATCIRDDGSLLAVLLTEMQVDLYDLTETPPKRTQSIILDHSPRAIAISPCGTVFAAAYESGIEVSSLKPDALPTERRAVKCDAVDALAFSFDGTQILGTTIHSSQPNTAILTAPYYDPGSLMGDDNLSALWTTSILFPNTSRDCSHAVFIQSGRHEEAGWTFTYDRSFETFRAVRVDDLRNGTTYFTGPVSSSTSQAKLIPCTLPAASYHGELVAAGFQGKEIWLYGVPEDLDAIPDGSNASCEPGSSANGPNRHNSTTRPQPRPQENNESARVPQWQLLCDQLRNTFVTGCKIGELDGVNAVKWVNGFGQSSLEERLVIVAPGVLPAKPITEDDGMDFVDGGRMIILDLDYSVNNGKTKEVTIEVGTKEPEALEEERRDIDTEVAIVRRRTVAQNRASRMAVTRAATTAARPPPPLPGQSSSLRSEDTGEDDPLVPRRTHVPPVPSTEVSALSEDAESESIIEEQEALDAPYSHASPRSGTTLRRAATAAAANRRLHVPAAAAGRVEYRRADGRTEHPHESDADNWVPPPPPYQKEDPGEMPDFMRHVGAPPAASSGTAVSGPVQAPSQAQKKTAQQQGSPVPSVPQIPQHHLLAANQIAAPPAQQIVPAPPTSMVQGPPAPSTRYEEEAARPVTRGSGSLQGDNIYDVSPPDSPQQAAVNVNVSPPENDETERSYDVAAMDNEMRRPSVVSYMSAASAASAASAGSVPSQNQEMLPGPALTQAMQDYNAPQPSNPPSLNLHIPPATQHNAVPEPNTAQPVGHSPAAKRLSISQTWPLRPQSQAMPTGTAGHPLSAPPVHVSHSEAIDQSYPPLPRPDQLASLHSRSDVAPRRLSGGFQVARVPVGSRASGDFSNAHFSHQRPLSQHMHPPSQEGLRPLSQSYQVGASQSAAGLRMSIAHVAPPHEETPLIISTPQGVTGAYDTPERCTVVERAETPLVAPVPRYPRPSSQAAVLRPTVERLETIYSVASSNGGGPLAGYLNLPAGEVMGMGMGMVAGDDGEPGSSVAGGMARSAAPGVVRKPSRAERSAAKNIADAKRRGWTPGRTRRSKSRKGRGKSGRQESDLDAMSSGTWTDVNSSRDRSGGLPGAGGGGETGETGHSRKRDRKCVVM